MTGRKLALTTGASNAIGLELAKCCAGDGNDLVIADDPAEVARIGYRAMLDGEAQVVSGWKNKLQAAAAHVIPAGILAGQHRRMAEPGSGAR